MKKQYWVKPKMTMAGFNKGNLYDFKQTADPKVIEVKNSKGVWVKMGADNFITSNCLFNVTEEKTESFES
jgi:hypothetical protein